jgi:O-antigen ligase
MAAQTRLSRFVMILEQSVVVIFWLIIVMNMFFSWEQWSHPVGDKLGDAHVHTDPLSRAIYIVLAGAVGLLVLIHWRGVLRTLFLNWPVLIFCAWILASCTWGVDLKVGLDSAARFYLTVLFAACVVSRYDPAQFAALLTRGFAIAVFCSLGVMAVAPSLGYSNIGGGYANAWRGAFVHKNWLGSAMAIGVIVAGYSYAVRANRRYFAGCTFLGCLFLLIMSHSATSWLATAAVFGVALCGLGLQSRGRSAPLRLFAFIALGFITVGALLYPLADIDLKALPRLIGRSSDLTGRAEVWRAVEMAIRSRPLTGYGYGFWGNDSVIKSDIWLSAKWMVPHAHNTWLDAWMQLGLIGLVMTVLLWFAALARSMRLVVLRYGHASLLFLLILVSCLSISFAETIMFAPAVQALFWFMVSYMYIDRIARQRRAEAKSVLRSERTVNSRAGLVGIPGAAAAKTAS